MLDDRMTNANPSPEPNDRPTEANAIAQLTPAEAIRLLDRDELTPEQLQAIAMTLHEAWK